MINRTVKIGDDVTEELGIQKYEPPVPACLAGEVVGPFPTSVTRTDEERIQNLVSRYDSYRDKPFYVTEKLEGTSCTAVYDDSLAIYASSGFWAEPTKVAA